MSSLRRHEGYLMMDHRAAEGVNDALMRRVAPGVPLPKGAGVGLFEAPTITCKHCQTVVIINPGRTRERPYCTKCDHYICDRCKGIQVANGGECFSFEKLIDQVQEHAAKQEQATRQGLILPDSEELKQRVEAITPPPEAVSAGPLTPQELEPEKRIIIATS